MHVGLILSLRSANEKRRYFVTTSLIDWAQAQNQPCAWLDVLVFLNARISNMHTCTYGYLLMQTFRHVWNCDYMYLFVHHVHACVCFIAKCVLHFSFQNSIHHCYIGKSTEQGTMAHIDVLVQDCSISSALAMEILQFCTKPSIWWSTTMDHWISKDICSITAQDSCFTSRVH